MNIRIALMGAPGSGKSALAQTLKTALADRTVAVVDDYVAEIEKETNLALGRWATYVGNLHVALGRSARERVAAQDHDTIITCGTLLETSVYAAMDTAGMIATLPDEDKADGVARFQAMSQILACLYTDTFEYDHLYYLPVLSTDEDWIQFDKHLQAAFTAFPLAKITPLATKSTEMMRATASRAAYVLSEVTVAG